VAVVHRGRNRRRRRRLTQAQTRAWSGHARHPRCARRARTPLAAARTSRPTLTMRATAPPWTRAAAWAAHRLPAAWRWARTRAGRRVPAVRHAWRLRWPVRVSVLVRAALQSWPGHPWRPAGTPGSCSSRDCSGGSAPSIGQLGCKNGGGLSVPPVAGATCRAPASAPDESVPAVRQAKQRPRRAQRAVYGAVLLPALQARVPLVPGQTRVVHPRAPNEAAAAKSKKTHLGLSAADKAAARQSKRSSHQVSPAEA
jgi:hypothetical protein